MAWLEAVPTNTDNNNSKKKDNRNRPQRLQDTNPDLVEFPPLDYRGAYLVGFFVKLGRVKQTGTGLVPYDWQDLKAWESMQGIDLEPREADLLIDLSQIYAVELSKSSDSTYPAPYRDLEKAKQSLGDKMDSIFKNRPVKKKGDK